MYAIIECGLRQYRVAESDVIEIERIDSPEGKEIIFDKVLLVSKGKRIKVGLPYLEDAKVKAIVLNHIKGKKIIAYKYRRRKDSRWKKGHRQELSKVQIKEILS